MHDQGTFGTVLSVLLKSDRPLAVIDICNRGGYRSDILVRNTLTALRALDLVHVVHGGTGRGRPSNYFAVRADARPTLEAALARFHQTMKPPTVDDMTGSFSWFTPTGMAVTVFPLAYAGNTGPEVRMAKARVETPTGEDITTPELEAWACGVTEPAVLRAWRIHWGGLRIQGLHTRPFNVKSTKEK